MDIIMLYFIYFFIYSFLGWIMEIIVVMCDTKKIVNRGFLIGPYCPIYGIACLILFALQNFYPDDFFIIFFGVIIIATIVEYLTSYLMEKMFNARWWDYSHLKFNIDGRVCLMNSIGFGILGTLVLFLVHPFIVLWLNKIPDLILTFIAIPLIISFITDIIISFNIMRKIKSSASLIKKDYTSEINKKVKEMLSSKSVLQKRLLNAFPNLKLPLFKKKK